MTSHDLCGTRFGHYRIVEQLGAGGMGVVYRARDERLDRAVAIKVLSEELAGDPERLKRFEREARALAALNHPNIATVHGLEKIEVEPGPRSEPGLESCGSSSTVFLVMELLEGESLREVISSGRLTVAKAVEHARGIADGLVAAHEKGIVHRDLKPENVFLTNDGRIKILDFGLAKLRQPRVAEGTETPTASLETARGVVMGTMPYMAPEQVRGEAADHRADIFALGCVLYEMLAGRRPFLGGTTAEVAAGILKEDPPQLPDSIPEALRKVIARCLEKRRGDRFDSAHDLSLTLGALDTAGAVRLPSQGGFSVRRRWPYLLAAAIAAVIALLVMLKPQGALRHAGGPTEQGPSRSIAILPLENLTGDPDQRYFVDGLHEELIATFARISAFDKVIARTSVMGYRESAKPIREIGRELGVDLLLEGSVRRSGDTVRATLQLIDAKTEDHLWANSFESKLTDILALQSDVARSVVSEVDLALTPGDVARLASARTVDPRAHEAYLKGSYHWKKLTAQDLDVAEHYFNLALEYDPSFAPAYQGLAWVWSGREVVGLTTPEEAGPKAKAAAERAIELDPSSAEAHEALALVKMATDWDWEGAGPEWRRALELNPNSANTHAYYAHFLAITGRVDEAVRHSERSIELDPVNSLFRSLQAVVLDIDRRFDDALAAARTALEIQPDNMVAISVIVDVAARRGVEEEGIETTKRYVSVQYPESSEALEECWTKGDYREVMGCVGATLAKRSQTTYVIPFDVAMFFAAADDGERTINWLEKGYEQHDPNIPYLALSVFDFVRSDPRFQDLRRRMNLPKS